MEIELFHLITDADSAEIRRYLVDKNLTSRIRFRNIAYDEAAADLKAATGALQVPCLRINGTQIIAGRSAILEWLKT